MLTFFNHLTAIAATFFRYYRHWLTGLVAVVIIVLGITALRPLIFMQVLELKTLDARFGLNHLPQKANDVVLIHIDDNSLKFFGDNGVSWPWPRTFYAHALNYLSKSGAKAVMFDLLFYQPDLDRSESDGTETDKIFADAISKNGAVVLGSQLSQDPVGFDYDLKSIGKILPASDAFQKSVYRSILAPVPALTQAAASLGIVNITADPDGIIRKVPLIYGFKDLLLPQMALAGLMAAGHPLKAYHRDQGFLELGDIKAPVDDEGYYHIFWYGHQSLCEAVDCVPFSAVIQSASAELTGEPPVLNGEKFKDKLVIIGATAAGLNDLRPTPAKELSPGMEIWATILLNFIHRDFFWPVPWIWDFVGSVLVSYAAFLILTRFSGLTAHAITLCLPLLIGLESLYFWWYHRLAVSLVMPLAGFLGTYCYTTAMGYLVEGRSRRQISRAMSRYLHPDLVKIIAKDPDRIEMGGREVDATVLFSDIYNFTTLSENFTPQELVSHLNHYFSDLSRFVLDHSGMLDKYTGDGIMALFGAPLPHDDHAFLACRAALDHRNFSRKLQEKPQADVSDKLHQGTRIGLHSGKIVAGNIGSTRRMDYTAIGDTVNLAARLEGVNKIYKTRIIISEACYQVVKNAFICRELDYLRVKGKKNPTRIYELIDERDEKSHYDWIEIYERALKIYRRGNFDAAAEIFARLAEGTVGDSASAAMLERCRYLKAHPPQKWDGILTLEVK
jgi:adenylate cyclase